MQNHLFAQTYSNIENTKLKQSQMIFFCRTASKLFSAFTYGIVTLNFGSIFHINKLNGDYHDIKNHHLYLISNHLLSDIISKLKVAFAFFCSNKL